MKLVDVKKDLLLNKYVYLMALPVVVYFVIFHYIPMYGASIAFKQYSPAEGILGSPWVGFIHFKDFFSGFYFWRLVRNTFLINLYGLIFGFPAPIVFALLLNEVKNRRFKKTVQTVTYMPYFVSLVVVAGIVMDFTNTNGFINQIIVWLGGERTNLLARPELFRTIFIGSGIWQGLGFNSIIYLAALSGVDEELYHAATIDGAGRWRQTIHITLPAISSTIIILLILRIGSMMNVGFEKIILLYSPLTFKTADVISSFVYRRGLMHFDYSYGTAIGLFNSIINFTLLALANKLSRVYLEHSLW